MTRPTTWPGGPASPTAALDPGERSGVTIGRTYRCRLARRADRHGSQPTAPADSPHRRRRDPDVDRDGGRRHGTGPPGPTRRSRRPRHPMLRVRDLKKHFPIYGGILRQQIGTVYAVDGVDFDVTPGEIFSLVGESGCGKTTLGRTLLQLTPPTAGRGRVRRLRPRRRRSQTELRPLRRRMQIIFQDPFGSLNPRMPVSDIIGEGLLAQGVTDRKARDKRVEDALETRRPAARLHPALPARVLAAASGSASASPGPSPSDRTSSSATSRCRRSTCRSRARSSTCCSTCGATST